MTEIKIEKKRSYWPWVLLGLLLLAVIVYFTFFRADDQDTTEEQTVVVTDTTTAINENAVADYISFISANEQSMGLDHNYTSSAITQLTEATRAIAAKAGVEIHDNLDHVNSLAERIKVDPEKTTHADSIKKAAIILSSSLQQVQQASFAQLSQESDKVIASAKAIDPDKLTLDQKEAVKTFFRDAADLLGKMTNSVNEQ